MGDEQLVDVDLERRKWKHRRRIAYVCLAALIGELIFAMAFPERALLVHDILTGLAYTFGALLAAYMGLSTFQHVGKK